MDRNFNSMFRRVPRFLILAGTYISVLFLSLLFAFLLRFDFVVADYYWRIFAWSLLWVLPLKLVILYFFGQFSSLLTFFSLPDGKRLALAMAVSALIEMGVWVLAQGQGIIPRGVIFSDMVISFLGLAGLRTAWRIYREQMGTERGSHAVGGRRQTAILGAGKAGALLLRDIQGRPGLGLDVVCLVDDDADKIGSRLHGVPVYGPLDELGRLAEDLGLQKVIIAMPGARPSVIKQVVSEANRLGLDHDILPSVAQLLHRRVTVNHLRHVAPEDLLGREAVSLDVEGISALVKDTVVMVTGAGGSIGSELCRQLAGQKPSTLILVERNEPSLFAIEQEIRLSHPNVKLIPRASNVCDENQMERTLSKYQPELVFHAAAHKHVPLMELQPEEAFLNNVVGTAVMARLAGEFGVRKFILVSTDKAVNPTSVMGATKRVAELVLKDCQRSNGNTGCAYSAVRFGNVLGSSGSVVPTFRRQIAEGGPLTVTDFEVTRFFMSIPEAVGLILQSAYQSEGGEIFVLDMGEPVKIYDLAKQMIELSGFVPGEDIEIVCTGLRPGEKLYEEPIHEQENVEPTIHSKVRLLRNDREESRERVTKELSELRETVTLDSDGIKAWMEARIPEYTPFHDE